MFIQWGTFIPDSRVLDNNLPYEARAEFCQILRSFFEQWSFKKKCFWDLLTFISVNIWYIYLAYIVLFQIVFISYDPDKWKAGSFHVVIFQKWEIHYGISNMYPMCYNFSDAVNYSFMVDAKVMATILSAKFNVFKNVEMNPTLLYCHNWKSRRKSVSKTFLLPYLSKVNYG